MFYIQVILTDNAQASFVVIKVCQPGGIAINFSKIAQKGPSIKYVSIFEGGGVSEMLTLADMGEGGYSKC